MLAFICTIEELSIEKLNPNHSKDKLKENVNDEDVEDIFEGDDDAVKNSFQLRNAIDCLQRSKHTQKFDCFQFLSGGSFAKKISIKIYSKLKTFKWSTALLKLYWLLF